MEIIGVETYIVKQQLDKPFYFSQWEYDSRQVCLVKIIAEDGTYGWGEGYGPANIVKAGIKFLAPLVVGENSLHVETIWQKMHLRSFDFARRGVLVASLSAIDIALWDLRGKLLGKPVSILLGGMRRNRVKVYATGLYFARDMNFPDDLVAEANMYVEHGFKAIKMKIGLGLDEDLVNVKAVRESLGPDIQLMVDANHAYSRSEARTLARGMEPFNITFF